MLGECSRRGCGRGEERGEAMRRGERVGGLGLSTEEAAKMTEGDTGACFGFAAEQRGVWLRRTRAPGRTGEADDAAAEGRLRLRSCGCACGDVRLKGSSEAARVEVGAKGVCVWRAGRRRRGARSRECGRRGREGGRQLATTGMGTGPLVSRSSCSPAGGFLRRSNARR